MPWEIRGRGRVWVDPVTGQVRAPLYHEINPPPVTPYLSPSRRAEFEREYYAGKFPAFGRVGPVTTSTFRDWLTDIEKLAYDAWGRAKSGGSWFGNLFEDIFLGIVSATPLAPAAAYAKKEIREDESVSEQARISYAQLLPYSLMETAQTNTPPSGDGTKPQNNAMPPDKSPEFIPDPKSLRPDYSPMILFFLAALAIVFLFRSK